MRVLVVDDSTIFRKLVRDCVSAIPGTEIVGVARDGVAAFDQIRGLRPDLVTLDVEMPGMNGLEVLQKVRQSEIKTNVIMVSSHTQRGAAVTTEALQRGAFDFILKPSHGDVEENKRFLTSELNSRLRSLTLAPNAVRLATRKEVEPSRPRDTCVVPTPPPVADGPSLPKNLDAIVIGISTGGPKALSQLIPKLPASCSVPILIVQHMPPLFTETLAASLDRASALSVVEARDRVPLVGGTVYVAPGGRHLRVGGHRGNWHAEITDDPPKKSCRPSVDYLFESAADRFGANLLGVVMTGMGNDGAHGSMLIREAGGAVWSQDEASSTVYGMPRHVAETGMSNRVLSLDGLTEELCKACVRGTRPKLAGARS